MLGAVTTIQLSLVAAMLLTVAEITTTDTYKRYREKRTIQKIKKHIREEIMEVFKENGIKDTKENYPKVIKIDLNNNGFTVILDISLICTLEDIVKLESFIKSTFKAYTVETEEIEGYIYLSAYVAKLKDREHIRVDLAPTQLLLGYNYKGNIVADMRVTPHLLICGLSGQGKTQMAKTIINNLNNADIVLINAFKHDFKAHSGRFIVGNENIIDFLKKILESEEVHKKPLYLVLDELLVLSKDKEISKCITDLLAIARHKNIYLIGISQIGTKEQLKFKDLFNARVCFRAIEESTYRTVLGCSVDGALKKREFYLYSNDLYKGRTFTNSN